MTAFRDLPIRRKLLLLTLASTFAALLVASAGFLTWDILERRREIAADVIAEARVLPEFLAASITFDRPEEVDRTLAVLGVRPQIRFVCVYTVEGALFGSFRRDRNQACPAMPPRENAYGWDRYEIRETIKHAENKAGILYLSRDLTDVHRRLAVGTGIIVALLFVAIATALVLARRMQRSVSEPLLDLADVARRVSGSRDYSIRATATTRDEIGVVVRSFNEMLDHIADRTTELSRTNAELQHANRLKDEFLATLSHELRTPMNAVLGWARVLRATDSDTATHERGLESIERNARAQARLIEDLLEISRIVTGKLRLQVRDIDLATIIETAMDIVRPAALAKRLQLDVQIGARPALTAGDPDRLQQVVWNLLSNAIKFTPADGTVTVRLRRQDGYLLTVEDSGSGIEPKFLPHVFDPFRQADGSATREHGGLGLGLAIAKQLVEAHGGTIKAHSSGKDQGATFEVRLPSVIEAPTPTRTPSNVPVADEPADPALLRGVDVLVVDDDEDARMLLQMTLSRYGAVVTTVASAGEALSAIDRAVPDVILSDIGMPHEDGYDLLRRLRARPPERGGTIPAVAVTAYATASDRLSTEAAGYQAHLAKPFEPGDVARLVRRLVAADQAAPLRPA